MRIEPYSRKRKVTKTIEVDEEVPYLGIHLDVEEARQLSKALGGVQLRYWLDMPDLLNNISVSCDEFVRSRT